MPLPSINKLNRNSARDEVYTRLRGWIISGPLEPGEAIRDADVALQLGVSRTPVREAIVRLEQEGLVEVHPGRWTRVAPLRFDRAKHLYVVGAVLDALAAELATPRLTDADLEEMEQANNRMHEPASPTELQEADEVFHGVYMGVAANPVLLDHYAEINLELRRFERVNFRDPMTPDVAYREHRGILDAMRARDAKAAAEAARFNWMNAWPRVKEMLAEAQAASAAEQPGDDRGRRMRASAVRGG